MTQEFNYEEIYEKAKHQYLIYSTSIRGQTITERDEFEWHLVNEAWQAAHGSNHKTEKEFTHQPASVEDMQIYQGIANNYTSQQLAEQPNVDVLVEALKHYSYPEVTYRSSNAVALKALATYQSKN